MNFQLKLTSSWTDIRRRNTLAEASSLYIDRTMEDTIISLFVQRVEDKDGRNEQKTRLGLQEVSLYDMISRASLAFPSTLNTVAAIWAGVRPASANWSAGEPWSMYRSGRTSGLHCKGRKRGLSSNTTTVASWRKFWDNIKCNSAFLLLRMLPWLGCPEDHREPWTGQRGTRILRSNLLPQ